MYLSNPDIAITITRVTFDFVDIVNHLETRYFDDKFYNNLFVIYLQLLAAKKYSFKLFW